MATNVATSDFVNVTLDAYVKKVTELPNVKYWLWNNLPIRTVNHAGEQIIYVPMQTALPENAYPSAEGRPSPSATSAPAFVKGYLYLKKNEAPMRFTEETVSLAGPQRIV